MKGFNMKTRLVFPTCALILSIIACHIDPPPDQEIQTAIAQTQTAGVDGGPPIQSASIEIEVYANQGWQSTGIYLEEGQRVFIEFVDGSWAARVGFEPEHPDIWTDASGTGYEMFYPEIGIDATFGSLLGMINGGQAFEIGGYVDLIPTESGELFLRMNDSDGGLVDNAGSIRVKIEILGTSTADNSRVNDELYPPYSLSILHRLEDQMTSIRSIYDLAFSPDGTLLASGSRDNTPDGIGNIRIWNVFDGALEYIIEGGLYGLAFSPDGQLLSAVSGNGELQLWRVSDGEKLRTPEYYESLDYLSNPFMNVASIAFSPDGTQLAIGYFDSKVRILDIQEFQILYILDGHESTAMSLAYSSDGSMLSSGSWDTTVVLWEVDKVEPIRSFIGHDDKVTSLVFSPDGESLVSGSLDNTIRFWDIRDGSFLTSIEGPLDYIHKVMYTQNGELIGIVSDKNYQSSGAWQASDGYQLLDLDNFSRMAVTHSGIIVASGSNEDSTITIWELGNK